MVRVILAVIGLAILASVAVAGLQVSLEDAGEDFDVTNETWTPNAGTVTTLEESNRNGAYYSEDSAVDVYDENGTEMDEGTDYEWFGANGTVKALTGGGLDGDSSATITYSFQQTTAEQRGMAALLGQLPRVMGFALPIGAFLFLLFLVRGA